MWLVINWDLRRKDSFCWPSRQEEKKRKDTICLHYRHNENSTSYCVFRLLWSGKVSYWEKMKKNFVSLFPHERRFKHAYLIGLSSNGISALIARNINRESKKIWVIDKLASPLRPDLFSKHLHSGCLPYSSLFERLLLCKMLQNRIYGVKKWKILKLSDQPWFIIHPCQFVFSSN